MYIKPATFKHIKRQLKIARQHGQTAVAGRFKKQHAMDCGRTRCGLCGNVRRTRGEKTYQELRALHAFSYEIQEIDEYSRSSCFTLQ